MRHFWNLILKSTQLCFPPKWNGLYWDLSGPLIHYSCLHCYAIRKTYVSRLMTEDQPTKVTTLLCASGPAAGGPSSCRDHASSSLTRHKTKTKETSAVVNNQQNTDWQYTTWKCDDCVAAVRQTAAKTQQQERIQSQALKKCQQHSKPSLKFRIGKLESAAAGQEKNTWL